MIQHHLSIKSKSKSLPPLFWSHQQHHCSSKTCPDIRRNWRVGHSDMKGRLPGLAHRLHSGSMALPFPDWCPNRLYPGHPPAPSLNIQLPWQAIKTFCHGMFFSQIKFEWIHIWFEYSWFSQCQRQCLIFYLPKMYHKNFRIFWHMDCWMWQYI